MTKGFCYLLGAVIGYLLGTVIGILITNETTILKEHKVQRQMTEYNKEFKNG